MIEIDSAKLNWAIDDSPGFPTLPKMLCIPDGEYQSNV